VRVLYEIRCGCGNVHSLKNIAHEEACTSCGWPMIYANDVDRFSVSRHADLTIVVQRTTSDRNKDPNP
jgi:peptide methionine sulfoxide reductase MsrB